MFNSPQPSRRRFLAAAGLSLGLVGGTTGCTILANLGHAVGADQIPPEYAGLADSRVAVVALTDASHYSDDKAARFLARQVGQVLQANVKKVRLVREDEISKYRDENGYDETDFVAIGEALEADKVIGIQVGNMTLLDGQSLYRGRSDVIVQVFDPKTNELLFSRDLDEYTYPESAGQHVSETTETKFQKLYLTVLAERIGRMFHPYDFSDTVALDGRIAGH